MSLLLYRWRVVNDIHPLSRIPAVNNKISFHYPMADFLKLGGT